MERILKESEDRTGYAVVFFDIKNFKAVNELFGTKIGDMMLRKVYEDVRKSELKPLVSAREDADHFICLVERKNLDLDMLTGMCQKKLTRGGKTLHLSVKCGIFMLEKKKMSVNGMIDRAKIAQRYITDEFVQSYKIYDSSMKNTYIDKATLAGELEEGIEQGQFKVYFQPQYSIKSHEIIGAEALVRWERDNGTVLSPNAFIPVYENNGKIIELDFYVFETVVEFIAENLKAGREQVPISINASSLHASDPQTINTYINILKKYSVDPTMVEIELTETAVVSEYESVRKLFDSFQLHGIKTAMDDFGSGYSVLNTIVDIPVDVIKIDRGFITSCLETDRGIYFLKHLIDMIRNLGYQIICEGVETDEQIEILRQIGCDEIQGYWYSKPLSMEDYKELLQSEKISKGGAKHPNRQKVLRYTLGNENLKERKIQ